MKDFFESSFQTCPQVINKAVQQTEQHLLRLKDTYSQPLVAADEDTSRKFDWHDNDFFFVDDFDLQHEAHMTTPISPPSTSLAVRVHHRTVKQPKQQSTQKSKPDIQSLASQLLEIIQQNQSVMNVEALKAQSEISNDDHIHVAMNWLCQRSQVQRVTRKSWSLPTVSTPNSPINSFDELTKDLDKTKLKLKKSVKYPLQKKRPQKRRGVLSHTSPLMELNKCMSGNKEKVLFKVESEEGPPHHKSFVMSAQYQDRQFFVSARTKKQAKHRLASLLLTYFRDQQNQKYNPSPVSFLNPNPSEEEDCSNEEPPLKKHIIENN
eukprot:c1405_g1_i1.p1 GENE.c1405_g1_i1~~c1405_g1_i1.p1  ORF type:complete len:321 (-),score=130.68 c1405_g1_i1:33-995(-)